MSSLVAAVPVIPGPPLTTVALNVAPALAPAIVGLVVLAVLGAIVILVGSDARGGARSFRNRHPVIAIREEKRFRRHAA